MSILLILGTSLGLFCGLLVCIEAGYRLGRWARAHDKADSAFSVVGGALLGLLGLILGFSFAGAQSRMDARRQLIVQEANAIGTAYLRLDLLLPADQTKLRPLMQQYTDARIEVHANKHDNQKEDPATLKSADLQKQIWTAAVSACETKKDPPTTSLLLPALNEMIDLTTTQSIARQTHLPLAALLLLIILAMLSGLLVGHAMSGMTSRNPILSITYALAITLTVYVILDLELPRLGLIRIDFVEDAMKELREGMK